jgi:hypothetical protein
MRCYFVKDARIVEFKELPGLSCKEAVEIARTMFEESASSYDGVDVWSLTRSIYRLGRIGELSLAPVNAAASFPGTIPDMATRR